MLLDSQLVASKELLAFHPSDASKTVFITSSQLQEYLAETGVKTKEVDFTAAAPAAKYVPALLPICFLGATSDLFVVLPLEKLKLNVQLPSLGKKTPRLKVQH